MGLRIFHHEQRPALGSLPVDTFHERLFSVPLLPNCKPAIVYGVSDVLIIVC